MARSTYIYIVSKIYSPGDSEIIGAFTVKHEMLSAVERLLEDGEYYDHLRIQRCSDGDFSTPLEISSQFSFP